MNAKLRAILDQIDEVLSECDSDLAHALWDVLTALRGPDNLSTQVKHETTVHIRKAAFPKTAARRDHYLADMQPEFNICRNPANHPKRVGNGHFFIHADSAYEALRLGIYEEQSEETTPSPRNTPIFQSKGDL